MKHEDLKVGGWVKGADGAFYRVIWREEQEAFLHGYGSWVSWDDLVERVGVLRPDLVILRPDSSYLEQLEPLDPPPDEILQKLERARRKRLAIELGPEFCFTACQGLEALAVERVFSSLYTARLLGCPADLAYAHVRKVYGFNFDTVGSVREAQDKLGEIVEQLGRGEHVDTVIRVDMKPVEK